MHKQGLSLPLQPSRMLIPALALALGCACATTLNVRAQAGRLSPGRRSSSSLSSSRLDGFESYGASEPSLSLDGATDLTGEPAGGSYGTFASAANGLPALTESEGSFGTEETSMLLSRLNMERMQPSNEFASAARPRHELRPIHQAGHIGY